MRRLNRAALILSIGMCVLAFVAASRQHRTSNFVIHAESLDYPEVLRAVRLAGTAVVRLSIASSGHVRSAEPVSGQALLAAEAVKNARTWIFTPGEEATVEVRYEFRLDPPGTRDRVATRVIFDFPDRVQVISREREME